MTSYTARASREEGWWTVEVDGVPGLFTQAKRLDQIPNMVRDALTLFPEVEDDPASAAVTVVPEDKYAEQVASVRELRDQAAQTQEKASRAMA